MPRVLAVLRLIVSSNFVGCMTARWAGFRLSERVPRLSDGNLLRRLNVVQR